MCRDKKKFAYKGSLDKLANYSLCGQFPMRWTSAESLWASTGTVHSAAVLAVFQVKEKHSEVTEFEFFFSI